MSNSPDTVLNTNQTDAEASGGTKKLSSESSEGSQVSGMNKQGLNLDPANTPEPSLTTNQDSNHHLQVNHLTQDVQMTQFR